MSKDLETFLAACSKKDYRVDFKLPEGGASTPAPTPVVPPVVVEPEVVATTSEVTPPSTPEEV